MNVQVLSFEPTSNIKTFTCVSVLYQDRVISVALILIELIFLQQVFQPVGHDKVDPMLRLLFHKHVQPARPGIDTDIKKNWFGHRCISSFGSSFSSVQNAALKLRLTQRGLKSRELLICVRHANETQVLCISAASCILHACALHLLVDVHIQSRPEHLKKREDLF